VYSIATVYSRQATGSQSSDICGTYMTSVQSYSTGCVHSAIEMYDVCLMSCVPHTCPMYVCTCHVLSTVVLSTTVQ
jgi:hypothetical protein